MIGIALHLPILALAFIATSHRSHNSERHWPSSLRHTSSFNSGIGLHTLGDEDSNTSHAAKDSNTSIDAIEMHNSTAVVGTRGTEHGVLPRVDRRIPLKGLKLLALIFAALTIPAGDPSWDREYDGLEPQAPREFSKETIFMPEKMPHQRFGTDSVPPEKTPEKTVSLPVKKPKSSVALPVKKPKPTQEPNWWQQAPVVTPATNTITYFLQQLGILLPARSKKTKRTVATVKFFQNHPILFAKAVFHDGITSKLPKILQKKLRILKAAGLLDDAATQALNEIITAMPGTMRSLSKIMH